MIYEYYSEKSTLGEKKAFEEMEEKKADFGEFNLAAVQDKDISVSIKDKKAKVQNSQFSVPLDFFISNKLQEIDYIIHYKEETVVKSGSVNFDSAVSGTSPKYRQLLASIEKAQKKREAEEEKQRAKETASKDCDSIKTGYEDYYSNANPSDYLTVCNFNCSRECREKFGSGSKDFKACRTECNKICKECF